MDRNANFLMKVLSNGRKPVICPVHFPGAEGAPSKRKTSSANTLMTNRAVRTSCPGSVRRGMTAGFRMRGWGIVHRPLTSPARTSEMGFAGRSKQAISAGIRMISSPARTIFLGTARRGRGAGILMKGWSRRCRRRISLAHSMLRGSAFVGRGAIIRMRGSRRLHRRRQKSCKKPASRQVLVRITLRVAASAAAPANSPTKAWSLSSKKGTNRVLSSCGTEGVTSATPVGSRIQTEAALTGP